MSDYTNRIEEAITEQFGERCPDFDAGCACCQAWAKFDRLKKLVDHAAGYAIELEQEQSRLNDVIKVQKDELDRLTAALAEAEKRTTDNLLAGMRGEGWSVAVHNDYRLNGEFHTFWLFTHSDGRYVKGEGKSDAEAISSAILAMEPK